MSKPLFDPESMRQRIRDELEKQRRTRADVTEKAGLGYGYLTNILTRGQMPSVDKLDAICRELNVPLNWVMYGHDAPADMDRILDALNRNPKRFYALLDLLE